MEGFSQTNRLGTLTLSADSFIDMGSIGDCILAFADSHSANWAGTLWITNWDHSTDGHGTDRIFVGSSASGLTKKQLSKVVFVNPNGSTGYYSAAMLATGEIVAVPEPGVLVLLATGGFLGLAVAAFRRQRDAFRRK
jgi:hypothetical protein